MRVNRRGGAPGSLPVMPDPALDPSRRTMLAAERTWLAWWRSAIAAAAAAIAVGGVVPELLEGSRTAYVVLGAGYAVLALVTFVGGALRQVHVERALEQGTYEGAGVAWVMGLTAGGVVLALGTLALIVLQS
jgi:putative membrane protein